MRALVQRVTRAAVRSDGHAVARIGPGLLVLLGIATADTPATAQRLADKVRALRVFEDDAGRMSEALGEREILCVSQFTLYGDTRRGNRPSFTEAAPAAHARPLYDLFCERAAAQRGVFGAHMEVELVNDGPVTLMLEAADDPGAGTSERASQTTGDPGTPPTDAGPASGAARTGRAQR